MPLFARREPGGDEAELSSRWESAFEATLRVSEIAASAAPLPEALMSVARVAVDLLEADQGSVMLVDDHGRSLVLVAALGLPTTVPVGTSVAVGEGVSGRVLATGLPLRLGEVDTEQFVNFVEKKRHISSSLVLPLRAGGKVFGVLSLAICERQEAFDDEDMRLAQLFADQTAALIHRARLHERAEHRSADLLALVEASRGLLGTLDVESLLRRALDGATRLMGCAAGFACTFDPESGSLASGVFRGLDRDAVKSLLTTPEILDVASSLRATVIGREDVGALAAAGLRTSSNTSGLLVVTGEGAASAERISVLEAYAQQCSSALGAAELHSEVQRKEMELSSIIQGIVNPIVLVDAQNRIVALNNAAEQLFSLSASFSAGATVTGALNHPQIEELLTGSGQLQTEVVAGNPPRTYKARVTDVRMPGVPVGRVLIMDDVTAERETVQTQRDFVAVVGHELRTPLTIIKGFAQTLLRKIETASVDDARDALAAIDTKADQLNHLVEDLLYVAKIEAREASLRLELVDVAGLVGGTVEELLKVYPGREVQIEVSPTFASVCDETKVSLVLRHLIGNALKYSEAPSLVTVRVTEDDDEIRYEVIDRGVGIVSSDIPHVFERFKQLDGSSTRTHGGTGVGLYLSAQLVRAHGGRIWADSVWGKGSTFSFAIPRRDEDSSVVALESVREESREESAVPAGEAPSEGARFIYDIWGLDRPDAGTEPEEQHGSPAE